MIMSDNNAEATQATSPVTNEDYVALGWRMFTETESRNRETDYRIDTSGTGSAVVGRCQIKFGQHPEVVKDFVGEFIKYLTDVESRCQPKGPETSSDTKSANAKTKSAPKAPSAPKLGANSKTHIMTADELQNHRKDYEKRAESPYPRGGFLDSPQVIAFMKTSQGRAFVDKWVGEFMDRDINTIHGILNPPEPTAPAVPAAGTPATGTPTLAASGTNVPAAPATTAPAVPAPATAIPAASASAAAPAVPAVGTPETGTPTPPASTPKVPAAPAAATPPAPAAATAVPAASAPAVGTPAKGTPTPPASATTAPAAPATAAGGSAPAAGTPAAPGPTTPPATPVLALKDDPRAIAYLMELRNQHGSLREIDSWMKGQEVKGWENSDGVVTKEFRDGKTFKITDTTPATFETLVKLGYEVMHKDPDYDPDYDPDDKGNNNRVRLAEAIAGESRTSPFDQEVFRFVQISDIPKGTQDELELAQMQLQQRALAATGADVVGDVIPACPAPPSPPSPPPPPPAKGKGKDQRTDDKHHPASDGHRAPEKKKGAALVDPDGSAVADAGSREEPSPVAEEAGSEGGVVADASATVPLETPPEGSPAVVADGSSGGSGEASVMHAAYDRSATDTAAAGGASLKSLVEGLPVRWSGSVRGQNGAASVAYTFYDASSVSNIMMPQLSLPSGRAGTGTPPAAASQADGPSALTAEDIRAIVREELAEQAARPRRFSRDELRIITRAVFDRLDELADRPATGRSGFDGRMSPQFISTYDRTDIGT
jgi:hypothetical protein